ncbi:APC family permease [Glaciibacter psychrotolerans]|uniref:Amino acid transporter n=1 Tax=Glaciibacter psychrotolerans TaxID=670054 RepID=A0A7Z0J6W6_9MICO|nr:APC family permease [Leifsonia psychrotolerans]NYJ20363.1 amino acid transporter [Leifsonia psychrotolerans]
MSTSTRTTPSTGAATTVAPRRKLGVIAVAFLIVAASAPLTVIAGGVTSTFAVTHIAGVPLSFLLLAAALAIFAIGYAAMSRFITNAGAFYSYVAQGIGRPAGVGASMLALVAYNMMQMGIYGMFGFQMSMLISEKTGLDVPWWIPVLVCIAIVGVMGVNRVDLSAKVLGVLVALEFLVVIVFDVVAFTVPTAGFSTAPLDPAMLFVPGVGAVFAFGIAAFMGFESAAIYGEESKDPRRTIPRATFLAVAVIGVFYSVSAWALSLAVGIDKIVDPAGITADEAGPPLFFGFVAEHMGTMWVDLMSVLFITSIFAALVSFHNAVARYLFSLGREGVLPAKLAAVRTTSGAPWAGSLAQTSVAALVIVAFAIGETGWNPDNGPYPVLTLFTWLTNSGALGLVLLMAVVSVAVIGYFRRDGRGVGVGSRLVAPIISALALAVVFVLILMNFDVLLGQAEPDFTTFLLPALVILPGIIGVIWGFRLRATKPNVYRQIGHGTDSGASLGSATAADDATAGRVG